MPVTIACPNPDCDASYTVGDEKLGRLGRCKKCRTEFPLVPHTKAETPSASMTDPDSLASPRPSDEVDLPSPFGRYQIVRTLGRGGMGAVYLAHDGQLDRLVALKVPHREFARNPDVRERFLREARAAARFHHPNFCPIHDIGEVDGLPYLTMAYIEGGTLGSTIERGRPWDQRKAAEVVRQLALALAEAHRQGVVHRDLKPANVMIDARGGLVLMDFGLARRFEADDPTLTAAGAVMGTPGYMSPEQADGDSKAIGPQSDIYSLGVILYELIAGRRPFEGSVIRILAMILTAEAPTPTSVHPQVSPTLEKICLKAMAKEIQDRHASMDELTEALQAWLDEDRAPRIDPPSGSKSKPGPLPDSWIDRDPPPYKKIKGDADGRVWIVAVAATFAAAAVTMVYMATRVDRTELVAGGEPAPIAPGPPKKNLTANPPPTVAQVETLPPQVDEPRKEEPAPPAMVAKGGPTPPPESAEESKKEPLPPDIPKPRDSRPLPKSSAETPPPPKVDETLITNTLGMALKLIPAGEFLMGSDASDPNAEDDEKVNGQKHPVRITRPFYLGVTEVTQGQYRAVTGESPSFFKGSDDLPVETVSWLESIKFSNALSIKEGLTPFYRVEGTVVVVPDWKGAGYRLPTEAEWEYACRGGPGGAGVYGFGDEAAQLGRYAWYEANSERKTHPVGQKAPNAFGLHDMHGNVWEWCFDWYDPAYYAKSPSADPVDSSRAKSRVIRGASWNFDPRDARSAIRSRFAPDYRFGDLGFRVARVRSGP